MNDYYQGHLCESSINTCAINPCQNNGLCLPTSTGYQCQCSTSYTGSLCQTPVNPCGYSPCQNGGQCNSIGNNSFYCACPTGIFLHRRRKKNICLVYIFKVIRVNCVLIKLIIVVLRHVRIMGSV